MLVSLISITDFHVYDKQANAYFWFDSLSEQLCPCALNKNSYNKGMYYKRILKLNSAVKTSTL